MEAVDSIDSDKSAVISCERAIRFWVVAEGGGTIVLGSDKVEVSGVLKLITVIIHLEIGRNGANRVYLPKVRVVTESCLVAATFLCL